MSQPWTSDDNIALPPLSSPPATVTVGEISFTDSGAKFTAQDNGIFTDYEVRSRYEKIRHRYMLGITSPSGFQGNSAAFVQLAAPTLLWVADWTALRTGTPPLIPDSSSVDPSWVLLLEVPELAHTGVAADGSTPLYRISGTYIYGQKRPNSQVFNDARFPLPPFLTDDGTFLRKVSLSVLQGGILMERGQGLDRFIQP